MTGILRLSRRAALAAISGLVAAASLVSFAESYRGLWLWARHHGLSGPWAAIWPLQVDVFIAVGELALFVALADRWPPRSRAAAWAVTLAGLAVSVAGNVGHVAGHSLTSRGTAAVPPLAAAAALAVGLGVLKRVVARAPGRGPLSEPQSVPDGPPGPAARPVPRGPAPARPGLSGPVPAPVSSRAGLEHARANYRASVTAGAPLSARALAARHGISRRQAAKITAAAGPALSLVHAEAGR